MDILEAGSYINQELWIEEWKTEKFWFQKMKKWLLPKYSQEFFREDGSVKRFAQARFVLQLICEAEMHERTLIFSRNQTKHGRFAGCDHN